ncbi:stage II sporulation protein P [Solibacillus sp. R5-41]|uniref:stage II sporulation protein P n=1 Tax=Solibacillus sp. R5-41 TaxID=2048654 RepID=UPI0020A61BDA|nr:stage II sporulation protein P [Solibacillus sp. R5-41]
MEKMKRLSFLLLFLFVLPIAIGQLPFPNNKVATAPEEQKYMVYAATPNISEEELVNENPETDPESEPKPKPKPDLEKTPIQQLQPSTPFNVLLLYTHSHESYKPIVEQTKGLQATYDHYDDQTNIFSMQEMMKQYLQLNGITPSVLDFDAMGNGAKLNQTYKIVRPVLAEQLTKQKYDLVLDLHRDSVPAEATTLVRDGESYAKVAFVVGAEHSGYKANLAYATALSEQLNLMVPGISRGILKQQGKDVNGIYNQDLSPVMLLIEFGGIENNEEELERTMAVLAQAIAKAFVETEI